MGENPKVGIPNARMKRASVVDDKISGLASLFPEEITACLKTGHHGFDSFAGVNKTFPLQSLTGPALINCTRKNYRCPHCTKVDVINIEMNYKDVLPCNSCFYMRAPILCLSFPSTALHVLLVGAVY